LVTRASVPGSTAGTAVVAGAAVGVVVMLDVGARRVQINTTPQLLWYCSGALAPL
jgi:hypothetical protein